jgi:hypothetical protein
MYSVYYIKIMETNNFGNLESNQVGELLQGELRSEKSVEHLD